MIEIALPKDIMICQTSKLNLHLFSASSLEFSSLHDSRFGFSVSKQPKHQKSKKKRRWKRLMNFKTYNGNGQRLLPRSMQPRLPHNCKNSSEVSSKLNNSQHII